jgi:hypothetical protein|tara:strand:+ start:1172 stop:1633 length:462 start_codon:yes stop_codon:yes gene_type:complete
MSGEQKLNEFMEAVEAWKSSKNIAPIKENEEIEIILNLKTQDIKSLSGEDRASYAYELYAYAEYIETQKVKESIVLDWAESSIWYIISQTINQYGDKYTKWQEKYYSAVRENPLASEILKIKNHAEARVKTLDGKADRIQSMAQILNSLSRRR